MCPQPSYEKNIMERIGREIYTSKYQIYLTADWMYILKYERLNKINNALKILVQTTA